MKTAYVYRLRLKVDGHSPRWYIGSRYSYKSDTEDLWKTYFTSSTHVKMLIQEYGTSAFEAKVVKIFQSKDSACAYEERFVRKAIRMGIRLGKDLS